MPAIGNALVVGGGPAGLSAALALQQSGVAVTLVELAMDEKVLGSNLLISSPNLRELDQLGLADQVVQAGVPLSSIEFHLADGTRVASMPAPNVGVRDLPPSVGITRARFHRLIKDAAVAAGVEVHNGTTVTAIARAGEGLEVALSAGRSVQTDLVVGADGWNSEVRRLWFPSAASPQYTGQCVWRVRVPRRGPGAVGAYAGKSAHAGLITVNDDHSYLFCLVASADKPPHLDPSEYPARLRAVLAEFSGDLGWSRDHLEEDTIHFVAMNAHIMPDPWFDGPVVLIGDAAHTTTPHIGYGAGLAVEDGVALAECLAGADSVAEALEAFMSRRFERARMVVENGLQISRWQQGLDAGSGDQPTLMQQTWQALAASR